MADQRSSLTEAMRPVKKAQKVEAVLFSFDADLEDHTITTLYTTSTGMQEEKSGSEISMKLFETIIG